MESDKLFLTKLPAICDDIKVFNGKLQLLINNTTYDISNIALFNQYDTLAVDFDNRVQSKPEDMTFKRVSYNEYI